MCFKSITKWSNKMNKKYDLISQDCEGGDKYTLTSGTLKECEDYQVSREVLLIHRL
jgi:hypothetical protein